MRSATNFCISGKRSRRTNRKSLKSHRKKMIRKSVKLLKKRRKNNVGKTKRKRKRGIIQMGGAPPYDWKAPQELFMTDEDKTQLRKHLWVQINRIPKPQIKGIIRPIEHIKLVTDIRSWNSGTILRDMGRPDNLIYYENPIDKNWYNVDPLEILKIIKKDPRWKVGRRIRGLASNTGAGRSTKYKGSLRRRAIGDFIKSAKMRFPPPNLATQRILSEATRIGTKIQGECPICMDDVHSKELVLLPCGHKFDHNCIDKWLRCGKRNCPLCRKRFNYKDIKRWTGSEHIVGAGGSVIDGIADGRPPTEPPISSFGGSSYS